MRPRSLDVFLQSSHQRVCEGGDFHGALQGRRFHVDFFLRDTSREQLAREFQRGNFLLEGAQAGAEFALRDRGRREILGILSYESNDRAVLVVDLVRDQDIGDAVVEILL